jgi:hypothetical protein
LAGGDGRKAPIEVDADLMMRNFVLKNQVVFGTERGTRLFRKLDPRPGNIPQALARRRARPHHRPLPDFGAGGVTLSLRPFVSGRDYHSMHHENSAFDFTPRRNNGRVVWQPYDGLPAIAALTNADYEQQPDWYRNFFYEEERARGLDDTEDLASPGNFSLESLTGRSAPDSIGRRL